MTKEEGAQERYMKRFAGKHHKPSNPNPFSSNLVVKRYKSAIHRRGARDKPSCDYMKNKNGLKLGRDS